MLCVLLLRRQEKVAGSRAVRDAMMRIQAKSVKSHFPEIRFIEKGNCYVCYFCSPFHTICNWSLATTSHFPLFFLFRWLQNHATKLKWIHSSFVAFHLTCLFNKHQVSSSPSSDSCNILLQAAYKCQQ